MSDMNGNPGYLRIRNWEKYQHYKDRRPPWIKFYVDLLDDEAHRLTDKQFGQLAKLFLLAARTDNAILNEPVIIAHQIGTPVDELELDVLIQKKYLVPTSSKRRKKSQWGTRYIPRAIREAVLARDQQRCVLCAASVWLEIDHIIPVSRGGQSTLENLQTLCRSCNRAKRAKTAEQLRSNDVALVLPETETEAEREAEAEKETPQTPHVENLSNVVPLDAQAWLANVAQGIGKAI